MDEKLRFWTYSLYKTSGGRMMDLDRPDAKVQCSAEQCSAVQCCAVQCSLVRLQVSKTEDWNLAVQTLGLQPGSFSRLFLRESLSL